MDVNREIVAQWVDALRSGNYRQSKGRLNRLIEGRRDNPLDQDQKVGMCCLGVLCHLAAEAGVVRAERSGELMRYDEETHVLPARVMQWAGFVTNNPFVDYPRGATYEVDGPLSEPLTILNDETGLTFSEIADAIEATYLAKSDAGQPA